MKGVAILVAAGSLWAMSAWPVAAATNHAEDIGFEFEAPPEARHQIGPKLWFGADVIAAFEYSDNYDLNSDPDDHLFHFEPEVRAVLSYAPSPAVQLFGEFQVDGRAFLSKGAGNDEKSEGHVRVEQLYAQFPQITGAVSAYVGRQRFKDGRAWWYDEKIDAANVVWERDDWFVAGVLAREKMFADDLVHNDTDEKIDFYMLNAGYYAGKRNQASVFVIQKKDNDSNDNEDPLFIGVQRVGKIGSDVRYWLNAAAVRGEAEGRKLRAYGVDGGLSVRFDGDWRPFVTVGVAYGSGDNALNDGVDGNFRQTGLQDNEGRTYGITSYNYYGEVVDLELSNLWIGTVGVGIKPDRNTSVEVIYHKYQQVDLDDDLFDTDLEIDPNGDHKDLGDELDLVIAHRPNERIKVSATFGVFMPGDGYDRTDSTVLAKLKFSYRF